MLYKICGLKYKDNINAIEYFPVDMMGFIFYSKSPRFVGDNLDESFILTISKKIKKVGVFVNQSFDEIIDKQQKFQLDYIQLHGDEDVNFCKMLWKKGISVIKAFQIEEKFDFNQLEKYESFCCYFLFDTKTSSYGGSGKTFEWSILETYQLNTPFLLSGGIGLENIDEAFFIKHAQLSGFDMNSKLELEPGLKSVELVKSIFIKINSYDKT
jgi:phosphoribosylanthranilate isomerase